MAESTAAPPGGEFWRDLRPIPRGFRPGALPETHIPHAPTGDERYGIGADYIDKLIR